MPGLLKARGSRLMLVKPPFCGWRSMAVRHTTTGVDMSPRRTLPSASSPRHFASASKRIRTRAPRHSRKGNSHAELTKSELEEMVFQAARMRAIKARSGA
jgi:hypothetical protein